MNERFLPRAGAVASAEPEFPVPQALLAFMEENCISVEAAVIRLEKLFRIRVIYVPKCRCPLRGAKEETDVQARGRSATALRVRVGRTAAAKGQ